MRKLRFVKKLNIEVSKPFNFDATFHKPDHFPSADNLWESGIRWQTCLWRSTPLGLKFISVKDVVTLEIYAENPLEQEFVDSLVEELVYKYNLKLDLAGFYNKFTNDMLLGPIIKKWKGLRPAHQGSLYEYLVIGTVLQNATVRRSIQMLQNLFEAYGELLEFDGKSLYCFWEQGGLDKVTEEELRGLKLGYRAKTIKRLDNDFRDGLVDEYLLRDKPIEVQKEELLNLYGIGPATVWYVLADVFHQWDFFDHISPWEQKIYSKLIFDQDIENPVSVDKLLEFFNRYGEYRQLALHYIWQDLWWKRQTESIPWLEKLVRR
jgi:3-methyladenine DNA glycosylase/8-oxoguanine DNA glycosylase